MNQFCMKLNKLKLQYYKAFKMCETLLSELVHDFSNLYIYTVAFPTLIIVGSIVKCIIGTFFINKL